MSTPREAKSHRFVSLLGLRMPFMGRVVVVAATLSWLVLTGSVPSPANPAGGSVVAGSATINEPSSNLTVINQQSSKAIINWNSFSIQDGETTQFIQPGSSSIALNRVTQNNPSQILGNLTANGQVWLVNPNGVFFGPHASVNVAGILATTADISNSDFMAGLYDFSIPSPNQAASVINQGVITVRDTGLAGLVAPTVQNDGLIQARMGNVILGGAPTFTLDFNGDGLIQFQATSSVLPASQSGAIVGNTGTIKADGGTVLLSAQAVEGVVNDTINVGGLVEARSCGMKNGTIVLDGGDSGVVSVTGTLDASGEAKQQTGGTITVTGYDVGLYAGSSLDASGYAGGGNVYIGGGLHGADPSIQNANAVYVDPEAKISADATVKGNGGNVVVWSQNYTDFEGSISAQGGPNGGNGGQVETSSHNVLYASGSVSTLAPMGSVGDWLLDPVDIVIEEGAGSSFTSVSGGLSVFEPATSSNISPETIIGSGGASPTGLYAGDVTIQTTDGSITVSSPIDCPSAATLGATSGTRTLTLSAGSNIYLDADVDMADNNLTLSAPGAVTQTGAITAWGLELLGGGTFTLTNSGNNVSTLAGNTGALNFSNSSGSLTIGTVNNTVGLGITGPVTIMSQNGNGGSGDITVASPIITDGDLGATRTVTLEADSDIIFDPGEGVNARQGDNTQALNVVLWSNASGNGGSIYLDKNSYILSNGGDIYLGGGSSGQSPYPSAGYTAPTGYAVGTTSGISPNGISLYGATLNAYGSGDAPLLGSIFLNGQGAPGDGQGVGIYVTYSPNSNGERNFNDNFIPVYGSYIYGNDITMEGGGAKCAIWVDDANVPSGGYGNTIEANNNLVMQSTDASGAGGPISIIGSSEGGSQTVASATLGSVQITSPNGFDLAESAISGGTTVLVSAQTPASQTGIELDSGSGISAGSSGSGQITLATTGSFINDAGAQVLNLTGSSGNWLIYSASPANNTYDGLIPDFVQYNAPYYLSPTTPAASGNGFLYSYAPSIGVTLTGQVSKTYDATTTATITSANFSGLNSGDANSTLSGVVSGDTVILAVTTSPITGVFDNQNAGTGKTVTATGPLSSDFTIDATANISGSTVPVYGYQVGAVSGAIGTINPASLTISSVTDTKTYDATTTATGAAPTVSGLQGSDTVSGLSEAFSSQNAGLWTMVVNSGYAVNDGNGGKNYIVTVQDSATGTINPASLTISSVTDTKTYDATTTATGAAPTVSGLQGSDTVSGLGEAFSSQNAGLWTMLVNSGYAVNDGNGGKNYIVTVQDSATGTINPASLTISSVTDTKTYDATTTATGAAPTVSGLQGSDTVSGLSEAFSSQNAGLWTMLVNSGYAVNDGNGGKNYIVTVQDSATGTINPAQLVITASDASRDFGESNPVFSASFSGFVQGDNASVITGLQLETNADQNSRPGQYSIIPSGATSPNYKITYVDGILNVVESPIVPLLPSLLSTVNLGDQITPSFWADGTQTFSAAAAGLPPLLLGLTYEAAPPAGLPQDDLLFSNDGNVELWGAFGSK